LACSEITFDNFNAYNGLLKNASCKLADVYGIWGRFALISANLNRMGGVGLGVGLRWA